MGVCKRMQAQTMTKQGCADRCTQGNNSVGLWVSVLAPLATRTNASKHAPVTCWLWVVGYAGHNPPIFVGGALCYA